MKINMEDNKVANMARNSKKWMGRLWGACPHLSKHVSEHPQTGQYLV
jgi:hypothetical protein